jgi:hypothetical protein
VTSGVTNGAGDNLLSSSRNQQQWRSSPAALVRTEGAEVPVTAAMAEGPARARTRPATNNRARVRMRFIVVLSVSDNYSHL